jgi:hypothetical protein
VKAQARECLGVAIKELGRLTPDNTIERRDPLLAIEQQLDNASGQNGITTVCGTLRLSGPDQ